MHDVFISYDFEDHDRVLPLRRFLERRGLSVWWAPELDSGVPFEGPLWNVLRTARCVLVLWSARSVESKWVHDEASDAKRRGTLVSAQLDDVTPPRGFDDRLCTLEPPDYDALLAAIRTLVDRRPDILVCAGSADAATVGSIDRALGDPSRTIWWDTYLDGDPNPETALADSAEAAKCLVVLWSENTVRSSSLLALAKRAAERHRLVPILAPGVTPPPSVASVNAARLSDVEQGDRSFLRVVRQRLEAPSRFKPVLSLLSGALLVLSFVSLLLAYELRGSPTWRVRYGMGLDTRLRTLAVDSDTEPRPWDQNAGHGRYWLVEWARALLLVSWVWFLLGSRFSKECLWLLYGWRWKAPFKVSSVLRWCRVAFALGFVLLVGYLLHYHTKEGPSELKSWAGHTHIVKRTENLPDKYRVTKGATERSEYEVPYRWYMPYSTINYLLALIVAFTVVSATLADRTMIRAQRDALSAEIGLPPYGERSCKKAIEFLGLYEAELLDRFGRYATVAGGLIAFIVFEELVGWKTLADTANWLRVVAVWVFALSFVGLMLIYGRYASAFQITAGYLKDQHYEGIQQFNSGNGMLPFAVRLFNREGGWLVTSLLGLIVLGIAFVSRSFGPSG